MATKSISQLDTQATANETDLFEVAIVDANSASGYASKKESAAAIADAIVGEYQYPLRITGTTAKTIAGAINELKNLVDLLPQFAIEVVQTLPVSDISETTIYLVPASDPEQGNYYEEYIYVNNAWELVGTTAVDLSGYYTSAQVDTLLAAKANTSSLATVATSGAYSDLSGKPTIDTALDDTSTNAVENRAVASEINSIKSDIAVEGSASGDIATFGDGSDNPLRALTISITPVQDLHGYDNPWPAGGGKNLLPMLINDIKSVNTSGTWTENTYVDNGVTFAFSVNNGGAVIAVAVSGTATTGTNIDIINLTGSLPSWITSGATFTVSGNATLAQLQIIPRIGSAFQNTKTNTSFSWDSSWDGVYIRLRVNSGNTASGTLYPMVESGSTATSFAPYSNICPISGWTGATISVADDTSDPTTYNIDWQDEAGTVYGGTLDVLNGRLTLTHEKIEFDGSNDEDWNAQNDCFTIGVIGIKKVLTTGATNIIICNSYKSAGVRFRSDCPEYGCIKTVGDTIQIAFKNTAITDITTWRQTLSPNPITVIYELAEPLSYQLTPTEIRSLLGQNNIWADCGAITELKYTRDLNLCINDIIARIEALEGASSNRSLSVSPTLTKSIVSDSDTAEGKTEEETEEETKEEAQKNER